MLPFADLRREAIPGRTRKWIYRPHRAFSGIIVDTDAVAARHEHKRVSTHQACSGASRAERGRRVGIDGSGLIVSRVYETATEIGRGAPVTMRSLEVGPIRLANLAASVNQADMSGSLLGMTFFRNVTSFEVRGRTLFIRRR